MTVALRDRLLADVLAHAEVRGIELVFEEGVCPNAATHVRLRRGRPRLVSATVVTRPIRSGVSYYTAMHEVGHVSCAPADMLTGASELVREARAWDWALARAIVRPTPGVWQVIRRAWTTYVWDETKRAMASGAIALRPDELADVLRSGAAELVADGERDWYLRAWSSVARESGGGGADEVGRRAP